MSLASRSYASLCSSTSAAYFSGRKSGRRSSTAERCTLFDKESPVAHEDAKEIRVGKYEEAPERFESVLGSKPDATEASVASYNVACCYSKLNQIQAGLSALEDALEAGFEDFKRIRSDLDFENVRNSEGFDSLLKKYDESIKENAINAIKSLFGFNKK